jgi:anaerobic selenocysteine-containing dehydrogenase
VRRGATPGLENDTLIADIVLPANTTFAVADIVPNTMHGLDPSSVALQQRAVPPLGESKSGYQVVLEVAKHLGMAEQVSEGKTDDEWIKLVFNGSGLSNSISWASGYENKTLAGIDAQESVNLGDIPLS